MRKLVFILAVAFMATNAAGCIISSGDDDGEVITDLGWVFKDLATNTVTGCPSGFDTVKVVAIPVDAAGNRIGDDFTDLLDCVDGVSGDLVSYDPGLYQIFLEIRQGAAGSLYAQSLSEFFDLTAADDTFDYTIFNDAGYFQFGWDLRAASDNAPLSCNAAGVQKIDITVTAGGQPLSANFPCADGSAVTDAILAGTYQPVVGALDPITNQTIGEAAPLGNKRIEVQNGVTDFGLLVIPIRGL